MCRLDCCIRQHHHKRQSIPLPQCWWRNRCNEAQSGNLIYGFSEDAVAAAKVVAEFAKTNDKLVIRAGAYGGKALDVNGVKQLASIPSKEVLLAQLLGLMQSPISRTARVLSALAEQRGAGAAEAAPAEAVAA